MVGSFVGAIIVLLIWTRLGKITEVGVAVPVAAPQDSPPQEILNSVDRGERPARSWGPGGGDMKRSQVEDVLVTVAGQREQLSAIKARGPLPHQRKQEFIAVTVGVARMLDAAADAARGHEPPPDRWLSRFWSGRQLEAAYPALHAAQVQFVDLYCEAEITAAIPASLNIARQYLDRDDPRRIAAEDVPNLRGLDRRAGLKAARESGYRARDLNHKQQRAFRNALIVATLITVGLVMALVGLLVARPDFAPICFESVRQEGVEPVPAPAPPPSAAPTPTASDASVEPTPSAIPSPAATPTAEVVRIGERNENTEQRVISGLRINCPTGASANQPPNRWDIVLVTFLGMVGASLAAAVTVRGLEVTTSPYDVPLALSLLKLPLGALTAFIGLVAIRGGLVPGLSALDSPAQILAYSVLLGYAQQLVTTFLDRRASNLGRSDSLPPSAADVAQRPSARANPKTLRPGRRISVWRRLFKS